MGRTHLGAGACALTVGGCAVVAAGWGAHLISAPETTALFALVCLAHFLRPDIDHPKALASRCFGFFSARECELWRVVAGTYYDATRAPGDPVETRIHRGLTHTPVGAVLFGLQAAVLIGFSQPVSAWAAASFSGYLSSAPFVALWSAPDWTAAPDGSGTGWEAAAGLLGLLGALAGVITAALCRALAGFLVVAGDWPLVGVLYCGAAATLVAAPYAWAQRFWWGVLGLGFGVAFHRGLAADWPVVAVAAALGAYGHSMGDGCTNMGSPLRHPKTEVVTTESGQERARWVDHGTPRWLRYPAGSRREGWWLLVTVIATVAAVIGTAALRVYVRVA